LNLYIVENQSTYCMRTLLLAICLFAATASFAQEARTIDYNTAIGAKISGGVALSYKKFIKPTHALEAQGMWFNEGIRFAALYEFHEATGVPGLSWYVGPGAHVGFWKKSSRVKYNSSADLGIDGVLGLDYKFNGFPLNISVDWQPGYSFLGAGLQPQFGGLAIRYVLQ
jgi:hypothetical protein